MSQALTLRCRSALPAPRFTRPLFWPLAAFLLSGAVLWGAYAGSVTVPLRLELPQLPQGYFQRPADPRIAEQWGRASAYRPDGFERAALLPDGCEGDPETPGGMLCDFGPSDSNDRWPVPARVEVQE